jgi:hypothetical protein
MLALALSAFAAGPDREAIKKRVDVIVIAINGGKTATDFKSAAKEDPFVFIISRNGTFLVHPLYTGTNIKNTPTFKEMSKADANGTWVQYSVQLKAGWPMVKTSYVRETNNGLIVGCGY